MDFTKNTIHCIKKFCGEFIEEHFRDEEIYFDEFWKVYEPSLQNWVGIPPKKWRLKIPRGRFPRVIGMADGSEAIELVTPKIIEVIADTYKNIAKIREDLSITKIEEIIKKHCGKKLPYSVILQAVGFFAPLIFQDLKKVKSDEWRELEGRLKESESPPFQQQEKKEYIMYTDKNRNGTHLTKTEYLDKKNEYENKASDFKFIIDEVDYTSFFEGININETGRKTPVSPAWSALIFLLLLEKARGKTVDYREVFENVWIGETYFEGHSYKAVEKWISMFRVFLGDKLRWFIKGQLKEPGGEAREFVFQERVDFKFCIFRYFKDSSG